MQPELFANMAEVERRHWWFRARARIVLAMLDALPLPRPARILDVGAGTGGTTALLTRYGPVTALEVDPEARRFLPTESLRAVRTAPLPDFSIEDGSFDLVTAFDVLEHVPDDVAVLVDIARLLVPGGHFVATVPAHPALSTRHDEHHHHQRRYTRAGLIDTLQQAGLEVRSCGWWMSTLFPVFLAERAWQRLRPPADGTVRMPPAPLNALLARVVAVERHWLQRGWTGPNGREPRGGRATGLRRWSLGVRPRSTT